MFKFNVAAPGSPALCLLGTALLLSGAVSAQITEQKSAVTEPMAQNQSTDITQPARARSPWLFTPLISSNPKFGSSIGGLGGYLHHFDQASPVSMFGVTASYSDTASFKVSAFANTFFDEDRQRIMGALVYAKIENDYEDFLGSGEQVQTTDDTYLAFMRYQYRISGDWFIGVQGIAANISSSSLSEEAQTALETLGLGGFQSNGIGAVVSYDSRDNTRSASKGSQLIVHNIAYRESLGGDASFDAYFAEYDMYFQFFDQQVTAIQFRGRWTSGAPNSAFSSVQLPGYTRGEFLAAHQTYAMVDQRIMFTQRWGMTVTAGLGCLYGNDVLDEDLDCFARDNMYPSIATGAMYMLKPAEKLVLRAEVSSGKGSNSAFILSFGQPF
jgi:hypothetical protein